MPVPQALETAQRHVHDGRLADAVPILNELILNFPGLAPAHHLLGLAAYRLGDLAAAEAFLRRAAELDPGRVQYRSDLAGILTAHGRPAESLAVAREAVALDPDNHVALNTLAVALQAVGQPEEAISVFSRVAALAPDYPDARFNLAIALQRAGRLDEAIALNREIIDRWPQHVGAHLNIGAALQELGRLDEAAEVYERLLAQDPANARTLSNMGTILARLGRLPESEATYRRALALEPDSAGLHHNLANVLAAMSRLDEAVAAYRRAVAIRPDFAGAHTNLGNVLRTLGRMAEAEVAYRTALDIEPDAVIPRRNLAATMQLRGELAEAETIYRQLLERAADDAAVHGNLGVTLQDQGRIDEALMHFGRSVELEPDNAELRSNGLLCLQYRAGVTPTELAAAHAAWEKFHGLPRRGSWRSHGNPRDPDRQLRVGFLSADLREHTVGHLVAPLFEHLDRDRVAVIGYHDSGCDDAMTERLRRAASLWRGVCGASEERLAEQIREDRVDVLFDLAGHTAGNRLVVFARRPAPVQISWLGYVGTTGLAAMDHVLADRFHVPEWAEPHYREQVLRMPDGYLCFSPPQDAPPVGPLPASTRGRITFGSLNNPAKFSRPVVAAVARILERVPGSRFVMRYRGLSNPPVRERLRRLFAAEGLEPERVEFLAPLPRPVALDTYNDIDITLDTFPYSGGITTCESIWMGVPVITFPGQTFAGRHGLSHLVNAGLDRFVARDLADYEELAVRWATDLAGLADARAGMRAQVAASFLCDGPRFATNFERVIRAAWRRWAERGDEEPGRSAGQS